MNQCTVCREYKDDVSEVDLEYGLYLLCDECHKSIIDVKEAKFSV